MKAAGRAAERYPRAVHALERLLSLVGPRAQPASGSPSAFVLGPAVLRAPPEIARSAAPSAPSLEDGGDDKRPTSDDMLGELVDMVFVGADEEGANGHHEVHLVFKAEVLGGLHLRLRKMEDGMHATFVVEDAAARRAVSEHISGLVEHLKGRGFTIASHAVEIAGG